MRPNEPIPFIANFMLKNKNTLIGLEELVKSHPEKLNESESFTKDINNMKYELEIQENEQERHNAENKKNSKQNLVEHINNH